MQNARTHVYNATMRGLWIAGIDGEEAERHCQAHSDEAFRVFEELFRKVAGDPRQYRVSGKLPSFDRLRIAAELAIGAVETWSTEVLAERPLHPLPPPPPPEPEPEIEFETITAEGVLLPLPYVPPPAPKVFLRVAPPLTDVD